MSEKSLTPESLETQESPTVDFEALDPDEQRLFERYQEIDPAYAEEWLIEATKAVERGDHTILQYIEVAERHIAATAADSTVESEISTEIEADEQEEVSSLLAAAMAMALLMEEIDTGVDEIRTAHKVKGAPLFSFTRALDMVLKKIDIGVYEQSKDIGMLGVYNEARKMVSQQQREAANTAREAAKAQRKNEQEQKPSIDTTIAAAIAGDQKAYRTIMKAVETSRVKHLASQPAGVTKPLKGWKQGDAVLEALRLLAEDDSVTNIDTELLEKLDSRTALALWQDTKVVYKSQVETAKATKASKSTATTRQTSVKKVGKPTDLRPNFVNRASTEGSYSDDPYDRQRQIDRQRAEDPTAAALQDNAAAMDRISSGIGFARNFMKVARDNDDAAKRALMSSLPRNGAEIHELNSAAPFDDRFKKVAEFYQERLDTLQAEMQQKLEERKNIKDGTEEESDSDEVDSSEKPTKRTINRELIDQVPDLLDGQLAVNATDRVYYGQGATAFGKNVGGRFAPSSQLRDIVAHADQIRDGLKDRDEPGVEFDPLVLSFIDQTHDALAAARDAAETRRRNELQQGGRFKRHLKNIWMGENGLAGSYYLDKYKKEALAQIQENGDVLTYESTNTDARTEAQLATIARFQSQYEESIHTDAGEQRLELGADSEFSVAMKDLLRRYASGEITDPEALNEERGRVLEQLNGTGNAELVGEGKVRIDNLLAVADQVKAMVDHGESIDRVLKGMKLYSAESRSNVRSEAHLGKIERLVERLQKSKFGSLVGPETIGIAAAVSLGVARAGRGTVLHALGVTVAPGVLGGAFAATRESKRLKQERAMHSREMAQGKSYDTGKRRDEIELTRYETVDASTLTAQLEEALNGDDITPDDVQRAYEILAGIEARIQLSDKRNVDLVSYSDALNIEKERRDLDEARALAKLRLTDHMAELTTEYRTRLGITDGQSINESLSRYTGAVVELDTDIDAKDKAYRKLRRRRVAKAAAIGAGTSLVFGLGTQELMAFASPSYDGLAEHIIHGGSSSDTGRQTVLEGLVHGQTAGTSVHEHIAPSKTYESYPLGSHQDALELPSDYKVVTGSTGSLDIEGPNNTHLVDGLTLQKDGALTTHSIALLKEHNVSVADTGHIVSHEVSTTKNLSVAEYNHEHAAATTHVTRDFWYDNNTAKFDKNELALKWGSNGTGINQSGAVQMNVSDMTQDGSSHGIEHTSWSHDAKEGKLKLAVSASRDTQAHPYFVDVKPDGTIDIPKGNPAAKFFSIDKSGHAQFHGAYAEVVDVRGETGGVTHIAPLATVVGSDSIHHISETVTTKTNVYVPHIKLTPPSIDKVTVAPARTVEGFGMPGFVPRRPLERLAERREINRYGYKGRYKGEYSHREGLDQMSPRLEADPTKKLVLGEELAWFNDNLVKNVGPEYVQEIEDAIQESPELQAISADTRTIITVPVAAASESNNIYHVLSLYAQQDEEQLKRNTVLLNVNWLDVIADDPKKRKKMNKTFSEIERARADFPKLSIATITHEYNADAVKKTGGVIGYVGRDLMNTALLAINRKIVDGDMAYDADVTVVRHDADMQGLSRHFLKQLEKSMDENPGVDIFQGTVRAGVSMQERYPGFGIITNLSQAISIGNAAANRPFTVGVNAVARAASLAAVNGLGEPHWTGVGSDDTSIAYRISDARSGAQPTSPSSGSYYYSRGSARNLGEHKIVATVVGMAVDTAPDRMLPQYLAGRHFGAAWNSDISKEASFDNGPGGYRDRTVDMGITGKIKKESFDTNDIYKRLESNISGELSYADETSARRALAMFFAGAPNAYVIKGNIGDGSAQFRFTKAGREFIKQRMTREVDGSKGAGYGARKMRQLYGHKRGGRSPVAKESSFVEPLK